MSEITYWLDFLYSLSQVNGGCAAPVMAIRPVGYINYRRVLEYEVDGEEICKRFCSTSIPHYPEVLVTVASEAGRQIAAIDPSHPQGKSSY